MLEAGVRSSDYTFEFSRYIQAGSNSGSRENDCKCLGTDVLWLTDPIILTNLLVDILFHPNDFNALMKGNICVLYNTKPRQK